MTEKHETEDKKPHKSGGCCCGPKKVVRVKAGEVKKEEAKPSCCTHEKDQNKAGHQHHQE